MTRQRVTMLATLAWFVCVSVGGGPVVFGQAQPVKPAQAKAAPGQFFKVSEPIDSTQLEQIRTAARQLLEAGRTRGRPTLIFEFDSGLSTSGLSEFGTSYDLADLISMKLEGAERTVAYVARPLSGYAALAALACDEIVMGPNASIGPITPEGQPVKLDIRDTIRSLAVRKGKDPDLYLGMLDRNADLRVVRTADKQVHYVFAENLEKFQASHDVVEESSAWDGARGVLTARKARESGFCKLIAESPLETARAYKLAGESTAADPILGQAPRPIIIEIDGPIESVKESYLRRRIDQARREGVNLIFFQMNSPGGLDTHADNIADLVEGLKDIKTVAYIADSALGVSALVALACNDIVFGKHARMGDVRQLITGRDGHVQALSAAQVETLARKAVSLAEQKGHPAATARALVDPSAEVVEAQDTHTGAVVLVLREQVDAEKGRYLVQETIKSAGGVLTITAADAAQFGIGQTVNDVEELKGLYGLRGKAVRVDAPGWIDTLVAILTDPFVSWLLLFIGLFMMVVEFKMPGIGLPAITASTAFLLFFWSHYLSGTADQLEIILFIVGMACLALEIFVFPGFGVFGMSGVLLVLISIVMASHTFIWPSEEYEYRAMGRTLMGVTAAMVAVAGGAILLARNLHALPLLNRLILKAEPWPSANLPAPIYQSAPEGHESLAYLVGETGRSTTDLKPTGKARFGDLIIDVSADGCYIETDNLIEVVDVQGRRVVVKRLDI